MLEFLASETGLSILVSCLVLALFVVPALVAMWEKRLVWNYLPVDRSDPEAMDGLTDFAFVDRIGGELKHRKFEFVASSRDAKGDRYRVLYEFWLSPDRTILVIAGGGTIFGLSLGAMWVFSRLTDGRCLLTVSDQNASELDPTGITEEALVTTTSSHDILRRHRERLALAKCEALEYSDDPLKDHLEYRFRRFNALVARGHAKFLDEAETRWKYTFLGAVNFSVTAIFLGMRRTVWPD